MQPDLRADCLAMFRLTRIEAPDTVRIGDVVVRGVGENLLFWLQCQIYKTFFCSMGPVDTPEPPATLMRELSLANAGGVLPRRESFTDQPGAYLAFGPPEPPGTRWLRLYWNVSPRGAIVLTGIATRTLHRLLVPFQLKVQLDTSLRRRDAAVLYLPRGRWASARAVIAEVCQRLDGSGEIQPETPLFTKVLWPGVALAEDPQTGLSFGMHRCGLVSRALAKGYVQGHDGEDRQWADLEAEFAGEGLCLGRPYLNAGSADVYEF